MSIFFFLCLYVRLLTVEFESCHLIFVSYSAAAKRRRLVQAESAIGTEQKVKTGQGCVSALIGLMLRILSSDPDLTFCFCYLNFRQIMYSERRRDGVTVGWRMQMRTSFFSITPMQEMTRTQPFPTARSEAN